MSRALLLVMSAGIAVSSATTPACATRQLEDSGIAAGVAAGITVELLKGIAGQLAGSGRVQVRVAAQTSGPDGDDAAFNEDYDDDNWIAEYYLNADTGLVQAAQEHYAWAELNYVYSNGAWRPDISNYAAEPGSGGFVHIEANAYPDSTPVPNSDNATSAGSVAAFCASGQIVHQWTKPAAGRGAARSGGAVTSEAMSAVYFTPDKFEMIAYADRVRVDFAQKANVDLFHTTAATSADGNMNPAALLSPAMSNLGSPLLDGLADANRDALEAGGGGFIVQGTHQAEVTIAGAALRFLPREYDAVDPVTMMPKSPGDLLREYLHDPDAVQVVAPSQAQEGYQPVVTTLQVLDGGAPVSDPMAFPDDLGTMVPRAHWDGISPDGDPVGPPQDFLGLAIGITGDLDTSLDVAAATPGSAMNTLASGMDSGDSAGLTIAFCSTSTSAASSGAVATIDLPEPPTLTYPVAIPTVYPVDEFTWTRSPDAERYILTIATDPGFGMVVLRATNIQGTSLTIPSGALQGCRQYFWRVQAVNRIGQSPNSQPRMFQTRSLADLSGEGQVNFGDFLEFFNAYDTGHPLADVDGDDVITFGDFLTFFNAFDDSCGAG